MSVLETLKVTLSDRDSDPLVQLALRLAADVDDPATTVRDRAGASRELRMVLEQLGEGAGQGSGESAGVFDLEARRRERAARRGS